ncbi:MULTISPECIES: hypothetical protein [Nocardia]|uniref:Uncharacterized protein n=1 Tax=Nocardia fluminea TaxID=134984 RepID=A0A2N3VD77_9NOCA|nr:MULTISPECIES: hypothetical protein [Nocardia]PKV79555.1 hypothetical protein ATK86_3951 [Nocardia fluminea]
MPESAANSGSSELADHRDVAPFVDNHLSSSTSRTAVFLISASVIYGVLTIGLLILSRTSPDRARELSLKLTIDTSTGIDLLAVIATVVVALNIAAWWTRTSSPSQATATASESTERLKGRAAEFARHLHFSDAALALGLTAAVVGLASLADAVHDDNLLTGVVIVVIATAISIISIDSQSGLRDSLALSRALTRHRQRSDLARLNNIVREPTTGDDESPPRWSDLATSARWAGHAWSRRLWWAYEVIVVVSITVAGPAVVVGTDRLIRSDTEGYWQGLVWLIVATLGYWAIVSVLILMPLWLIVCRPVFTARAIAAICAGLLALFIALPFVYIGTADDSIVVRLTQGAASSWWILAPIIIMIRSLVTRDDHVRWFPARFARRALRRLICLQIASLKKQLGIGTQESGSSGAAIPNWLQFWTIPMLLVSASRRWYRSASGMEIPQPQPQRPTDLASS